MKKFSDGIPAEAGALSESVGPALKDAPSAVGRGSNSAKPSSCDKKHGMRTVAQRQSEIVKLAKVEIMASGQFLTPKRLALRLDVETSRLAASLVHAESLLKIFSIEHSGERLYPRYAFLTDNSAELVSGLHDVLNLLHTWGDGWDMAFWFRSPNTFIGGRRPEDVIRYSVEDVRAAAQEEMSDFMPG